MQEYTSVGTVDEYPARSSKKDTYMVTLEMLQERKSLEDIVAEREMQERTILSHLERLAEQGAMSRDTIAHLLPGNWHELYRDICVAIRKHGDERLKPLYEHCNEQHTYSHITLARIIYRLGKQK